MASASELIHMATARRAAISRANAPSSGAPRAVTVQWVRQTPRTEEARWIGQPPGAEIARLNQQQRASGEIVRPPATPIQTPALVFDAGAEGVRAQPAFEQADALSAEAKPVVPAMRNPPQLPPLIPAAEAKRKPRGAPRLRTPPLPAPKSHGALDDVIKRHARAKQTRKV